MKTSINKTVISCLFAVLIAGCSATQSLKEEPQDTDYGLFGIGGDANHPTVIITTSMGSIVIRLDAERAPITVNNFLSYVRSGFYTNTVFHRVIPGFMIQGGGHEAGSLKLKTTINSIVNEYGNGLKNTRGSVAMARSSALNSATSQFYINLVDNPELDKARYAVFGEVVLSMETVDRIAAVSTTTRNNLENVPVQDVVILSITINE